MSRPKDWCWPLNPSSRRLCSTREDSSGLFWTQKREMETRRGGKNTLWNMGLWFWGNWWLWTSEEITGWRRENLARSCSFIVDSTSAMSRRSIRCSRSIQLGPSKARYCTPSLLPASTSYRGKNQSSLKSSARKEVSKNSRKGDPRAKRSISSKKSQKRSNFVRSWC